MTEREANQIRFLAEQYSIPSPEAIGMKPEDFGMTRGKPGCDDSSVAKLMRVFQTLEGKLVEHHQLGAGGVGASFQAKPLYDIRSSSLARKIARRNSRKLWWEKPKVETVPQELE